MVMAVIGGLALAKIRRLVQIFPSSWMVLWDEWEIRVVILYSLLIQIVLMAMGSRRKYMSQTWARVVVWAAYLSADWAATFALGLLSDSSGDHTNGSIDPDKVMTAFMAPFFILHLGGPDTITAYSLEDSELWLRHFLSVIAPFVIALYVFLKLWRGTLLDYAGIPIFLAGLIKCEERTLALRFASESYFTDSMIDGPETRQEYIDRYAMRFAPSKFRELLTRAWKHIAERCENKAIAGEVLPTKISLGNEGGGSTGMKRHTKDSDSSILHDAYKQFLTFVRFSADFAISARELKSSWDYLRVNTSDKAFKLIEIELGLLYDLRYTKAKLTYSRTGCLLRFFNLSSSVVAFVIFLFIDKHQFSHVDLTISWLLLVGALSLEFYAVTILISSDWFMIWLNDPSSKGISKKLKDKVKKPVSMIIHFLQLFHIVPAKKRWSGTMGQYNLISFCHNYKMPSKGIAMLKLFGIFAMLEKERHTYLVKVPKELKEWMFVHLRMQKDLGTKIDSSFRDLMLADVAKEFGCYELLTRSGLNAFENIEMDESILIWHIATDLCYNEDLESQAIVSAGEVEILRGSKWLSGYMLYLLVTKPSMLPKGIGQLRFQHTCFDVKSIVHRWHAPNEARSLLYDGNVDWKLEVPTSVLSPAKSLANRLQSLMTETGWEIERKWKFISNIWLEMLFYAAVHCSSNEHAQQLRRGGELLTQVWFLMAHIGFTRLKKIVSLKKTYNTTTKP